MELEQHLQESQELEGRLNRALEEKELKESQVREGLEGEGLGFGGSIGCFGFGVGWVGFGWRKVGCWMCLG